MSSFDLDKLLRLILQRARHARGQLRFSVNECGGTEALQALVDEREQDRSALATGADPGAEYLDHPMLAVIATHRPWSVSEEHLLRQWCDNQDLLSIHLMRWRGSALATVMICSLEWRRVGAHFFAKRGDDDLIVRRSPTGCPVAVLDPNSTGDDTPRTRGSAPAPSRSRS